MKKNKMKIDSFRIGQQQERKVCDICNKITYDIGSIRIRMQDPKRRYSGSNRAIISNYRLHLCSKCFKEVGKRLDYIIYGDFKKD